MSELTIGKTERGFVVIAFTDSYDTPCSLQKSSVADYEAVWLGVNEADPKIKARDAARLGLPTHGQINGWVAYHVPEEVLMTTRMHLTQKQVIALLPYLIKFAAEGEL